MLDLLFDSCNVANRKQKLFQYKKFLGRPQRESFGDKTIFCCCTLETCSHNDIVHKLATYVILNLCHWFNSATIQRLFVIVTVLLYLYMLYILVLYVAWLDCCYYFEAFMEHLCLGTRRGLYTMYVMYDNIIFSYVSLVLFYLIL